MSIPWVGTTATERPLVSFRISGSFGAAFFGVDQDTIVRRAPGALMQFLGRSVVEVEDWARAKGWTVEAV